MFGEIGDVLFSAVNVSRHLGVDAEDALAKSADKFVSRFAAAESLASERGQALDELGARELDILWNEAKKKE